MKTEMKMLKRIKAVTLRNRMRSDGMRKKFMGGKIVIKYVKEG